MGQVCGLTDIIFDEYSDDHFWELKPKPDEVEKFGTSWMSKSIVYTPNSLLIPCFLESALDDIRTSKTWNSNKCEALIRTTVDIILFDRMMLVANTEAARKLLIAGEYTVRTKCANKSTEIVGRVDYAMGYGREAPLLLDSPYIAIGIKTVENFSSAQHQLAAYLRKWILCTVTNNKGRLMRHNYSWAATDTSKRREDSHRYIRNCNGWPALSVSPSRRKLPLANVGHIEPCKTRAKIVNMEFHWQYFGRGYANVLSTRHRQRRFRLLLLDGGAVSKKNSSTFRQA